MNIESALFLAFGTKFSSLSDDQPAKAEEEEVRPGATASVVDEDAVLKVPAAPALDLRTSFSNDDGPPECLLVRQEQHD